VCDHERGVACNHEKGAACDWMMKVYWWKYEKYLNVEI
jgi:hypothetical protein